MLSFVSNEQTYQALNNVHGTMDTATDEAVNYLSDTYEDVEQLLFCQGGEVTGSIISEVLISESN